jgi:hypothetical protein
VSPFGIPVEPMTGLCFENVNHCGHLGMKEDKTTFKVFERFYGILEY